MSVESRLDELTVRNNPEERRYEARIGTKIVGVISYHAEPGLPGLLTLVHTEVDPAFEGKGVGSRLVTGALEDIRHRGQSLVPLCPFVRAYLKRHPEHAGLVATG